MMRRLIPLAIATLMASSAYALPVAPTKAPNDLLTDIRAGCGVGYQPVRGVCVPNSRVRRTRRVIRREVRRCTSGFEFVRGRCVLRR